MEAPVADGFSIAVMAGVGDTMHGDATSTKIG